MFIISSAPSTCWASANVRALRVSASSWLCSAMTPAPQQLARSSSTSSMSSNGAIFAIEPCSSGVKPRDTQPGQYATFMSYLRGASSPAHRFGASNSRLSSRSLAHDALLVAAALADDVEVELEALVLCLDLLVDAPHLI